jgi:hypothetical protein
MTLHPANASSQPLAVAPHSTRQSLKMEGIFSPAAAFEAAPMPGGLPGEEAEGFDLLARRRRRRARLEARR